MTKEPWVIVNVVIPDLLIPNPGVHPDTYYVVVSGLPGSGKSTLARQLAVALDLPLLDKDTILESLFELKGVGCRRELSRESDVMLQAEAMASEGAVLVSHWRLPGMPLNSGTPTTWLSKLSDRVVNVHCQCPAEVAAERFCRRMRHPGHGDHERSHAEILASIRELAGFGRLHVGPRVEVDTSQTFDLDVVVREIQVHTRQVWNLPHGLI
jgi:glucokinase